MTKHQLNASIRLFFTAWLCFTCCVPTALADKPFAGVFRGIRTFARGTKEKLFEQRRPEIEKEATVEQLADQIDWLEHHIEIYGSAVPKKPDIWGEARLTRHREDVERELEKRITAFGATLQGSLRRTDQAGLALAAAMDSVSNGGTATGVNIDKISLGAEDRFDPQASATGVQFAGSTGSGKNQKLSIELEPTLHNDQLFRYLNALNELRRINEGDDTADSPGYSLNLIRIPVSILPGKRTREGYGAEVSFTIQPQWGENLLPNTFRQLTINDQVDQLSLPIVRNLERYPVGNVDDDPLAKLKAMVRGERFADPTYRALVDRLQRLSIESEAYPHLQPMVQYSMGHLEYWRRRLIELHAVAVRQGQYPITPSPTVVRMSKINLDLGERRYEIQSQLDLSDVLPRITELLHKGVMVIPLAIQVREEGTAETEDPILAATFRVIVHEQSLESPIEPGNMPYRLAFPIGTVFPEEGFQWDSVRMNPQLRRIIERSPESVELLSRINKVGIHNNGLVSNTAENLIQGIIEKQVKVKKEVVVQQMVQLLDGDSRLPLLFNQTTIGEDLDESFENVTKGSRTEVLQKVRSTILAEAYRRSSLLSIAPTYVGQVADSADQVVLPKPLFSSSVDGPAAPNRGRRSIQPVAASQFSDVYGFEFLLQIASTVERTLRSSHPNNGRERLLMDVRRIMADELSMAYDFLCQDDAQMRQLWAFASAELAHAIRMNDMRKVREIRYRYIQALPDGIRVSATGALGWCLIVQSSLLSERLIDDIGDLSKEKGCGCGDVAGSVFWGPDPSVQAREAFQEYVQCRWPIQVFALDPTIQEQNFADSFSSRRELQLAAAISVANGHTSASAAGQFVRSLTTDLNALGINRTQLGFSHGENSFGWRFYPRIQSPSTPNTFGALYQTMMGTPGRDGLVRDRQMEPGIRQCTAVVVMPSFIPYVTLSSRTNWFSLTNPADKELTMNDTMKLSAAHQSIRRFASCASDCGRYRPGDVAQLSNVIENLDQRLPMQTSTVQIPYGNALGGFELFHTGTSDLAPQLVGWYGAPGIDPNGITKLFLVGKGFSVHETRVIAGGRPAEHRLLSREIMEVTIPPSTQRLGDGRNPNAIDIHVATPYGASSHMLVPTVQPSQSNRSLTWKPTFLSVVANIKQSSDGSPPTIRLDAMQDRIGVSAPNQLRMKSGKIEASLSLRHPTQLKPAGKVTIDVVYDPAMNRFATAKPGLGKLDASITSLLSAELKNGMNSDKKSVIAVITGKLNEPKNGSYNIENSLAVLVNLNWQ